ncbi:hypothetical protein HDU91_003968, partial [Kappamyces sp. JEL0680]
MAQVQQRQVALWVFVAIQTIKLAQTLHGFAWFQKSHGHDEAVVGLDPSFILVWCGADLIYFLLLRRYTRPRLNLLGVVVLTLAMFGLNAGFIAALNGRFGGEPLQPPSASDQDHVARQTLEIDSILNESFIVGSHTVKVRPPTRAKLNPHRSTFCLDSFSKQDWDGLLLPVLIKGTGPFLADYDVTNEAGKVFHFYNTSLSSADVIKYREDAALGEPNYIHDSSAHGDKKSLLYGLQPQYPSRAGSSSILDFKLVRIKDHVGDDALLSSSLSISIVSCPKMGWKFHDQPDKCLDDQVHATIQRIHTQVEGMMPLSVLYVVQAGNNERIESIDSIDSSLEKREPDAEPAPVYGVADIPITSRVDVADAIVYKLLRVTDALNNSVQFPISPNTLLPPIDPKSTNKLMQLQEEKMFVVQGHAPPQAFFSSPCQDIKIRTFYDSQTQRAPQAFVGVAFEGAVPLELEYEFRPDSDLPPQPMVLSEIDMLQTQLVANEPGQFRLLGVKDKYCVGAIKSPTPCHIQSVPPPTFSFSTSPIEETCFGAVGAKLDLSFTGEPPYFLDYVVSKREFGSDRESIVQREHESFTKHRSELILKPLEPGHYRYQFDRVGDKNYQEGIPVKDSSLVQIIHPHSTAAFSLPGVRAPYQLLRCKSDKVSLDVVVQGSGPWDVTYDIVFKTSSRKKVVKVDAAARGFSIDVDDLNESGLYTVDLVEIKDGNGCVVKTQSDPVVIEVLQSRPSVSFSSQAPIYVLEGGRASLPISLSGRGPFLVGVKHHATGQVETLTLQGSSRFIDVVGDGVHELVSVSDSICTGSVEAAKQVVTVMTVPKPFMKLRDGVQELNKDDVCQGGRDHFQVELVGKAPFRVSYTRTIVPSDSSSTLVTEYTETIDTFFIRLAVDTSKPGLHTYRFQAIADDNYRQLQRSTPLVISQRVNVLPSARFLEPAQRVFYCTSSTSVPYQLQLMLTGKAPFSVTLEQKRDNQHVKRLEVDAIGLETLESQNGGYVWTPTTESVYGMGKHEFILQSVSD